MATDTPAMGIAPPVMLQADNNDMVGLVDAEPCPARVGRYRYQQLQFGLMRSLKALAIFAEHGLVPDAGANGLHWVFYGGGSPEAFRVACYHAWRACYDEPRLRPLFEQWKLKPSEGNHA